MRRSECEKSRPQKDSCELCTGRMQTAVTFYQSLVTSVDALQPGTCLHTICFCAPITVILTHAFPPLAHGLTTEEVANRPSLLEPLTPTS